MTKGSEFNYYVAPLWPLNQGVPLKNLRAKACGAAELKENFGSSLNPICDPNRRLALDVGHGFGPDHVSCRLRARGGRTKCVLSTCLTRACVNAGRSPTGIQLAAFQLFDPIQI